MPDLKPLSLTDEQLSVLMAHAEQLHALDRDPFLRALADRFAGRAEIGDGEFGRALRAVLHDGRFKWQLSGTPWQGIA
jgi:hypothetical protein